MSTILLDRPATTDAPTAADHKSGQPSWLQGDVPPMPMTVSATLLAEILQPYHPAARYLKSAAITHFRDKSAEGVHANRGLISARGTFSICQSCYIEDTGHFNAVEFNICFNQLAYVMFGKCIDAGLMHKLRCDKNEVPTFAEFKQHQLPNMVIVQIESRYYHQLDSGAFEGTLELDRIAPVGNAWFFFTTMTFADHEAIKAKGKVVLAFSPAFKPVTH
jgi:hypothetical protein